MVATVGRWAFDYATLLAALAAVGSTPRPALVLLAFCAAQVLAQIPVTPGGLGFVEAGLTAMLALAGVGAGQRGARDVRLPAVRLLAAAAGRAGRIPDPQAARRRRRVSDPGALAMNSDRISYIGHATTLIELDGVRLLTDPVLRGRMLGVIVRDPPEPEAHVTERLDAVLVSHLHHDHLDLASLSRIGRGVPIVVPPGGAKLLRRRGFERVTELDSGEMTAGRRRGADRDRGGPRRPALQARPPGGCDRLRGARRPPRGLLRRRHRPLRRDGRPRRSTRRGDAADRRLGAAASGTGHLDPRRRPRRRRSCARGSRSRSTGGRCCDSTWSAGATEFLRAPAERFRDQLAELAPGVEAAVLDPGDSVELAPRGSA